MKRWLLSLFSIFLLAPAILGALSPEEIINKVNSNFEKIKDAQADVVLEAGLQLFGCGGLRRQEGQLYFKSPDKLRGKLDGATYFAHGNNIRKVSKEGKRYYVTLVHAPDFRVGFNPRLITHNFNINLYEKTSREVIIEGIPKPGVLKNVKKIYFHIDTNNYLLRQMDLSIVNGISGKILLKYKKINGIDVPVAMFGKSALEIGNGMLVGLIFNLKGDHFRINTGLSEKIFDPGF